MRRLAHFPSCDQLTLVATDSGIGGLAITADIVERLSADGPFRQARIIFFNIRPSQTLGFDAMATAAQRQRVFSRALDCMVARFGAQAIVLACNTLSVIYPQTGFARRAPVPVLDIVGAGVDLMLEYRRAHPDTALLLFGSDTTVRSAAHKRSLIARGVPPEWIIDQSCPHLANAIEQGPGRAQPAKLIARYVAEALARVPRSAARVAAVWICTHFDYAVLQFRQAFLDHGLTAVDILDPGRRMVDAFFRDLPVGRFTRPEITVEVVTQTAHSPELKQALGPVIAARSARTAAALRQDTLLPGLFAID